MVIILDICDVFQCDELVYAIGLCKKHATMHYRYGTPQPIIQCCMCPTTFKYGSGNTRGNKHYCIECWLLLSKYERVVLQHIKQPNSHGINKIQLIKLFISQGFKCKLCDETDRLFIDHDHSCCDYSGVVKSCGKCIRGLLCNRCNVMVGSIERAIQLGLIDSVTGPINEYLSRPRILV